MNNTNLGTDTSQTSSGVNDTTSIGAYVLSQGNSGLANTALGANAALYNASGSYNTASGASSLYTNTAGVGNTSLGASCLYSNATANYMVGVGARALFSNNGDEGIVAVGTYALENYGGTGIDNESSQNVAVGHQSSQQLQAGTGNTTVGFLSGWSASSMNQSVGVGAGSLGGLLVEPTIEETSSQNVAVGYQSLGSVVTASENVAIGSLSGTLLSTGVSNILVGTSAGSQLVDGSRNIILGDDTGDSSDMSNTLSLGSLVINTLKIRGSPGSFPQPASTCITPNASVPFYLQTSDSTPGTYYQIPIYDPESPILDVNIPGNAYIGSTSNGGLKLQYNGTNCYIHPVTPSGDLCLGVKTTSDMYIDYNGNTHLNGTLTANSTVTVAGALTANSTVTVSGALTANGSATIAGALTANGSATIAGALTASSTATIAGALTANGSTTMNGTVTTTRAVYSNSTLTANDFGYYNTNNLSAGVGYGGSTTAGVMCMNMALVYMLDGRTIYPFFCSNSSLPSGITNNDNYYLLSPGVKLEVFSKVNYDSTSEYIQIYDNTNGFTPSFFVTVHENEAESIKIWYKNQEVYYSSLSKTT